MIERSKSSEVDSDVAARKGPSIESEHSSLVPCSIRMVGQHVRREVNLAQRVHVFTSCVPLLKEARTCLRCHWDASARARSNRTTSGARTLLLCGASASRTSAGQRVSCRRFIDRKKAVVFIIGHFDLINYFLFAIRQLLSPCLDLLWCLSHPICYFADNSQWCLTAIRACWIARKFFVCDVRVSFKAPGWFDDINAFTSIT